MERKDDFGDNWWLDSHELFVAESIDKEPDVLFLGDSHVALLEQSEVYQELFAPLHCLCFGMLNESTDNLLWRIQNGELEGIKPKVIVLSIGSDDVDSNAEKIADRIRSVTDLIREKQTQAEIFVLKLFPSGKKPNPRRQLVHRVNELLVQRVSGVERIQLLDVDPGFVSAASGVIDHHDMFDYRHLSQQGYRKAFELVFVSVQSALNPDQ